MTESFVYETTVVPDWIDDNGHMRDAYFGLIFSLGVDALQDEIGFDEAYRARTGCTIYLLEDHKYFLREVKPGARIRVGTVVLDSDEKRFHLQSRMSHDGDVVAIGEFMELHVRQHPAPQAAPMPQDIAAWLAKARVSEGAQIAFRSREMTLRRRRPEDP